MAQVDEITQVERELEAFRARAQDTLKSFDRLEELVSEFGKTSQAFEAEVGKAAEEAELLKDKLNEIDLNWLHLKSEVDEALEQLNRFEIERDGHWAQYIAENKKIQDELTSDFEQRFAEVAQGLDAQASRLDDIQSAIKQRWTMLEEDLGKMKSGLVAADQNLRTQLKQMVTDLRGYSEQRFAELTRGIEVHDSRLNELQTEFERHLTKLQEDGVKMQNDVQAAQGDLRTALWKMVDDLRGEEEGRFSEINKNLARQAAKHEEANEAIEARIVEANNRLAGELEASLQEYRKSLSLYGQSDLALEQRIDKLQVTVWVLLAIAIIVVIIIICKTY